MNEQDTALAERLRATYDDGSYPDGFFPWVVENRHVYSACVRAARGAKVRGLHHWGIQGVLEVLRWQTALRERGATPLKINNNAASGLARLIMARCPDLAGFFRTREPPARRDAVRLDGTPYREVRA